MSPKAGVEKDEKAAPSWRRVAPGRYQSSDDRFQVDSEGSGRWFLRDQQEHDELGLARTTGPYATLDAAKEAAAVQRERGPEPSPLAPRPVGARGGRVRARAAAKRRAGAPAPRGTVPRTWLDRLAETDRTAARRARALIEALEAIGVVDADTVVRRDLEGLRPVVAEAVLAVAIRRELGKVNDPARLLEAVLEVVSMSERLDADDRLPGWRLVEVGGQERRIRVTAADVLAGATAHRTPRSGRASPRTAPPSRRRTRSR